MNLDNPNQEVFRDHVAECIQHLKGVFARQKPPEAARHKKQIAEFCGVDAIAVRRWLNGDTEPLGEQRVKLMCCLDSIGYRVIELERMDKTLRGFGELIGFGLLSIQNADELLGYSEPRLLFRVLRGGAGTSQEKTQKMWDMWKSKKEELERAKKQARANLKSVARAESSATPSSRHQALINIMEGIVFLMEESKPPSDAHLQKRISALASRLLAIARQMEVDDV